jgi:hypothetical protein
MVVMYDLRCYLQNTLGATRTTAPAFAQRLGLAAEACDAYSIARGELLKTLDADRGTLRTKGRHRQFDFALGIRPRRHRPERSICSTMMNFDYSAPAELYAAHERKGLRYRRFSKAAGAIQ